MKRQLASYFSLIVRVNAILLEPKIPFRLPIKPPISFLKSIFLLFFFLKVVSFLHNCLSYIPICLTYLSNSFLTMDLRPDLPPDVFHECLIRVSYNQLPKIASICEAWKTEIERPEFFLLRKAAGYAQKLVVMAQARDDPERRFRVSKFCHSVYRLSVLDPSSGNWDELPTAPGLPNGLPYFCQITAVGSELVVMGGLEPGTWEVSRSVHVFNFLSGSWRRGVDIPGVQRLFFGCASDHHRMVYVAGGHDGDKNALRSAMQYDVEKDDWTQLPDMARQRDECKGIFQRGKFHVIGGYCTAMQGRFETSAEEFDVGTWRWNSVEEEFLEANTCPRTCTAGDEMDIYLCRGADVVTRLGAMWKTVARLPPALGNAACVVTWRGKLLAIGSSKFGKPHRAYVLDLEKTEYFIFLMVSFQIPSTIN